MIRRWLAAVRGLDAEDEAAAARLREAGSPFSEEATADATDVPEGGEKCAPPETKKKSASGDEGEVAEVAEVAKVAEVAEVAALVTAARPAGSPPGSPPDPDAEWADVQMPAVPVEIAGSGAEELPKLSIDVVAEASASDAVAARFFRSERGTYRSEISREDDVTYDFRDVLLRSECLENLVGSFARAPARDDAEAGAFAELVDALVWPARGDEKTNTRAGAPGGDEPAYYRKPPEPAEEENTEVTEDRTRRNERDVHVTRVGPSVAALLVSGVARAGAALRHPKRAAEVQLGDDALVEMLAACAGSVKRVGAAETLRRREARLRAAGDANAAAVRALSAEAREEDPRVSATEASEKSSEKSSGSSNREDTMTDEKQKTKNDVDPSIRHTRPTSALAAATRLGVDLARRAHDHAAARATRLAAESELAPTADALARCRASLETLARASSDVAGLSEQSRCALLEAERFREEKLAECVAVEGERRDAARVAEERRAEAAARLAILTLEASRLGEEAEHAAAERRAFEESAEAVRETLEQKVRDLRDRAEEYRVESAAIAAARDALSDVARARASALEAAAADADADLASARRRYVEAARAHGEGQAGAARLCLARLRFCKKELEETRRKRAEASALGLRGGEESESGATPRMDFGRARLAAETTGAETTEPPGSLSADLRLAQRSIERAYVEAERGAKAVFAAAEASRREATAIAPAAMAPAAPAAGEEGAARPAPKSPEDPPGVLAAVFGVIDEARAVFAAEAATRPALEIEETEETDETDETEETEEPTDAETAETEKEEKASLGFSENVAEGVAEDVAAPFTANAVSGKDAPTDVSESETEPSVPRVAPVAPEPKDERPAEADAPGTNAAETTTDDVDDWLADD